MNGADIIAKYFKFFAMLGDLFEARFLRPLWQRYPSRESDDWEAIGLFLDGYAFARQGARPDYSHVAVDVVQELARQGYHLTDKKTAHLAWYNFSSKLNDQKLNHANNPLCPCETSYERKHKGNTFQTVTNKKSVIEFIADTVVTGLPPNIVVLARDGLELDSVKGVHSKIREINGIDSKIASLFLRDVAIFYDMLCFKDRKDRCLLQPVDIWVRRTYEKLMQQGNTSEKDTDKIREWILQESLQVGVRPEAVNEGIWYFSSQVAGSEYRMSNALNDLGYAEALLDQYIQAMRREVLALDSLGGRLD